MRRYDAPAVEHWLLVTERGRPVARRHANIVEITLGQGREPASIRGDGRVVHHCVKNLFTNRDGQRKAKVPVRMG